jgi:NDP-sugar pyrophosphorylase family protein
VKCRLDGCVIGSNCSIAAGVILSNAVIGNDTTIFNHENDFAVPQADVEIMVSAFVTVLKYITSLFSLLV